MRHGRAIDLYIADLAHQKRTARTRDTYRRQLNHYADFVDPHGERDVRDDSEDDCRRFLARWQDAEASTLAQRVSIQRSYFAFLVEQGHVEQGRNPMARIKRPKRPRFPKVVQVKPKQVNQLIAACRDEQELICVGAAAYFGRRRTALANARRRDADLDEGYVGFLDKGGKWIEQPIPDEFLAVLRWADKAGVWQSPDDYLIPNRRKVTTNPQGRSSKIIYETVIAVGKRAGVKVTVHALRRAFAVNFLKAHPGEVETLQTLLDHEDIETTMLYLRGLERAERLEQVRNLSWAGGSVLSPRAVEAHTGFEPVLGEPGAASPLKAKLDELIATERARDRARR